MKQNRKPLIAAVVGLLHAVTVLWLNWRRSRSANHNNQAIYV